MKLSAKAIFTPGDISGLVNQISAGAVQGVTDAGRQALELEQSLTPVDTGALRDSETCVVEQDGNTVTATIGPQGIFYDTYVEYGTGQKGDPAAPYAHVDTWPGMHPQPYARPMLDEMRGQVLGIVADAVKSAL